ncbi:hypothetical protein V6N13_015220 [Hibiscus sabdariffa]
MRLFEGRRGFELATKGEGRNGVEDGKRNATFAGRGDVVDSNLVRGELEIGVWGRDSVEFSQEEVAMIHQGFKP